MAARTSFKEVSPDYLRTVIVQRCEFDEASMGSAIPMDADAIETAAADDAGSFGQRGVGPGLGKGGPPRAPMAPTRKLPPAGILGWELYDRASNNGFPPGMCVSAAVPRTISAMTALTTPTRAISLPAKAKAKARARASASGERVLEE